MLCKRVGERNNLYVGNNTESGVDMKKAKKITVIYYRIKGKPRRNKIQYRILKSARLKIKLYLNKINVGCGHSNLFFSVSGMLTFGIL